jgi:hypothetical protein
VNTPPASPSPVAIDDLHPLRRSVLFTDGSIVPADEAGPVPPGLPELSELLAAALGVPREPPAQPEGAPPTMNTATTAAPTLRTLKPGVGATIYGELPRDIAEPICRASDFVTLHTAADASDVASAAKVRSYGCGRVWLALPANYFVRLGQTRGVPAAIAEARRCARIAADMGAEAFEFNGEGQQDGQKPGDWIPANPEEARGLAELAAAIIGAAEEELRLRGSAAVVLWTSHDMPSFRLPWGTILRLVGGHSPQHYPAQKGRFVRQKELMARVATSRGQRGPSRGAFVVGQSGTYTVTEKQNGEYVNVYLNTWTPNGSPSSNGGSAPAPAGNRDRSIVIQCCIKAACDRYSGMVTEPDEVVRFATSLVRFYDQMMEGPKKPTPVGPAPAQTHNPEDYSPFDEDFA